MATKTNPFVERAPAIRACAECAALVRDLQDEAMLPTKAYKRSSELRRAKWLELAGIAERQAQQPSEPVAVRRVARKAKAAPITASDVSDANTSVPITQAASA